MKLEQGPSGSLRANRVTVLATSHTTGEARTRAVAREREAKPVCAPELVFPS